MDSSINYSYFVVSSDFNNGRPEFTLSTGDFITITDGDNAGTYRKISGAAIVIAENANGDTALATFATSTTGTTFRFPSGGGGSVNNTAISPSTVQIGGTTGQFTLIQEDTHIARGTAVGLEANTVFSASSGTLNIGQIVVTAVQSAWVQGTTYFMDVSGSSDSVIEPGNYLVTIGPVTSGGTTTVFQNVRRITRGEASAALTMNNATDASIRFDLHTFTEDAALAISNGGTVDSIRVGENNVADFAEVPTVNGTRLAEAHQGIQRITTNLPHHSYRLVHDSRQYWVYINTNVAVPNDISIHLHGCLLYTSPSPRDS